MHAELTPESQKRRTSQTFRPFTVHVILEGDRSDLGGVLDLLAKLLP